MGQVNEEILLSDIENVVQQYYEVLNDIKETNKKVFAQMKEYQGIADVATELKKENDQLKEENARLKAELERCRDDKEEFERE